MKSGVRLTCNTTALIVAFDYREDEATKVNLGWTREKMSALFPQQYLGESADGAEPAEGKIGALSRTFIIVMSQTGQGASFAGWCDNARVRSRYGKIEKRAEKEGRQGGWKGRVFSFLQRFITLYFPLIQASPESANSTGQMEMRAERLARLWLPSAWCI